MPSITHVLGLRITLLSIIAWAVIVQQVESSGIFELRLKSFQNDRGRDNVGACCSGRSDPKTGRCIGTCKTRFHVCLKNYQATIDPNSRCTFGDVVTPVLGDNTVNLTNQQPDGFINPIRFPFEFTWPGTFTLSVEAWHVVDTSSASRSPDVLISRLSIQRVLDVSAEWTEDEHRLSQNNTSMQYAIRVTCDANYYGAGCGDLCRPRDDQFGHYTCSSTGNIVCLSGWQGGYCTKPRCAPGCDEQHGQCAKPNECVCNPGWKGALCTECEPYPGCINGTCEKPWECKCNEGWGGLFCNQDLNYCTNHKPCQNGGICFNTGQGSYTCQCPPGYMGTDCDTQISSCEKNPCMNGATCHDVNLDDGATSFRCECHKGWIGRHCENKRVTCAEKPCLHGKCTDTVEGFRCTCPTGYDGTNCEVPVNDCSPNPCENGGMCQSQGHGRFLCQCPVGFTGTRCENNEDDCTAAGAGACLNGGTCIDLVNGFRCQCVPGYIGSACEDKVDICLTKPCANGGSCVSLNNDYKCNCRAGFTGKDCSMDIDECQSFPCRNGGSCVNRVNNYQCVCPTGYRGSQCETETSDWDAMHSSSPISRRTTTASLGGVNPEAHSGRSDGLSPGQIVLIAILSVAMPVVAISAICVVICMKKRRKRAQEKDDAEARKQNEQNAVQGGILSTSSTSLTASLSHHQNLHNLQHSSMLIGNSSSGGSVGAGHMGTCKRNSNVLDTSTTSSSGSTTHNMIKNTWDKCVNNNNTNLNLNHNNLTNSLSVDDCLMSPSASGGTGGGGAYQVHLSQVDPTSLGLMNGISILGTSNDCLPNVSPLKRARSQKQLNTDPKVMHRASQIMSSGGKEFVGEKGSMVHHPGAQQRWMQQQGSPAVLSSRQIGPCSPPHM